MSFKKPYQKSTGKIVHRNSRKAKYSATIGYLGRKPAKYRRRVVSADPPRAESLRMDR